MLHIAIQPRRLQPIRLGQGKGEIFSERGVRRQAEGDAGEEVQGEGDGGGRGPGYEVGVEAVFDAAAEDGGGDGGVVVG